jgi:hypothetical protein
MRARYVYENLHMGLINESYESSLELERLADFLIQNKEKFDKPVKIKDLIEEDIIEDKFPILEKFLKSEIAIIFDLQAKYPAFIFPPYDESGSKIFSSINDSDYPHGVVIINKYEDALLHELQHAYDFFRSGGKILSDKKVSRFFKMGGVDSSLGDSDRRYYRLKPEQSSYFVEIMYKLKRAYFSESLSGIDDSKWFFEIFKDAWPRWDLLTDKDKKIIARKFFQYWGKFMDGITQKKTESKIS